MLERRERFVKSYLQARAEKRMIILRDTATSRYHPYHPRLFLFHPHSQHTQPLCRFNIAIFCCTEDVRNQTANTNHYKIIGQSK